MADFTYSDAGIELTKKFEGLELSAYADQGGVWTVGYGHTGPGVFAGVNITHEQADIFLQSDIAGSVACVNRLVTGPIEQCQFDALVDFTFNLGCANLSVSTLLRAVNAGHFKTAKSEFLKWDHVRGRVVQGLLNRRQAEAALFSSAQNEDPPEAVISLVEREKISTDLIERPAEKVR